ncbi:hypothetical protein Cgig2_022981 [Carnegiea gigantea]|uniref:Uncharacterized protein n=1 Tax=Carnegiea gigantea TaxID=171969 RepID=A0A9Q1Q763_9CARY|nr:hypothetical protein Cgig2_022981 [Carnegiea gigantea]
MAVGSRAKASECSADPAASSGPVEDSGFSNAPPASRTLNGDLHFASSPQRPGAEVLPTSSSSSLVGTSTSSSSDGASASSSSEGLSTGSSSDEASTSSSKQAALDGPGRVVLKKRGRISTEPVLEVVAKGLEDDSPRPISKFMVEVIGSIQGPENRKSKSSNREPWNWLPSASEGEADALREPEQIVAEAERRQEGERARLVNGRLRRCTLQPSDFSNVVLLILRD